MEQKQLFGWFKSDKEFTRKDVAELLEEVKKFNAGCIDEYLSAHVDRVFEEWLRTHEEEK